MFYDPKLSGQVLLSSGQWNADCPFCGKEEHFFMNSKTGLWDCKKCGEVGNWFSFFKKVGIGVTNEKEELKKQKQKIKQKHFLESEIKNNNFLENVEMSIETKNDKNIYIPQKTLIFPESFKKISIGDLDTTFALKYILKRKYKFDIIKKHNLLYCINGLYWNRLIIPIYINQQLKGYLGRWIQFNEEKVKRKYRNSFNTDFSMLLGNYDNLNNDDYVIICEGAFSSYRINYNSTFAFGKKLSEGQVYLLKQKKIKKVFVLFDSDAQKETLKICKMLVSNNFKVRTLLLEKGDPDDLDNEDGNLYERLLKQSFLFTDKEIMPVFKFKNFF